MDGPATATILCALQAMPDPRHHNIRHQLIDLLTIALFAVIGGAEGWVDVARYGRCKHQWLQSFLALPNGIPSHDTFGEVFARLDPAALEQCFRAWVATLVELSGGKLVAIDGKSLRRSFEHGWDRSGMAHLVSAFVQANHLVFAQEKTEGKGQELEAIDKLLGMLDLKGAVVTIDALGCQKTIAQQVLDAGGNYLLQVKENQPMLQQKLAVLFQDLSLEQFAGIKHDSFSQTDGDHGRIETRRVWVIWDVPLLGELAEPWPGLRSLILVQRTRDVEGKGSVEWHHYISSLDGRRTARQLAGYIRGHWSIENNLHWQLDVSFNEDQRRIRKGNGAENFSRLCRMSLNLLKQETSAKVGIATKRKMCGWDNDYLLKVITA
jgi:predicted transposase YbfD/YdcC